MTSNSRPSWRTPFQRTVLMPTTIADVKCSSIHASLSLCERDSVCRSVCPRDQTKRADNRNDWKYDHQTCHMNSPWRVLADQLILILGEKVKVAWRGGVVVSTLDLQLTWSQVQVLVALLHVVTLGKLFTHMCLCSPNSINWSWCKLGAKQALHTSPASAGAWLKAKKTEISAALWACVAQEGLK